MKVFSVLILAVMLCSCYHPSNTPLFLYQDNGKTGYIDQQGKIVIPARFAAAQDFSEGLAAVRIGGYYGYIDKSGKTSISAQFDYATGFSHGLALVYKGQIAQYIDKTGRTVSPLYLEGEVFTNGTAIVTNFRGKHGLIDSTLKLILDTIYQNIGREKGGLLNTSDSNGTYQLLDGLGKPLPFARSYLALFPWQDTYIIGQLKTPDSISNNMVVLDLAGGEHFRYNSGLVYPRDLFDDKIILDSCNIKESEHLILYDIKRQTTLLRGIYSYTPFNNKRALVTLKNWNVMMVTSEGEVIPTKARYAPDAGFQFGYAFATGDNGWGMIDTTGKFVLPPEYGRIVEYGVTDSTFLFGKIEQGVYGKIGIADRSGKIKLPMVLQSIDQRGFVNGLLQCEKDNLPAYIDPKGKVIWQGKKAQKLPPMNIDYMRNNEYYATDNSCGFFRFPVKIIPPGKYHANPEKIRFSGKQYPKSLSLQVDTVSPTHIDDKYKGYKVIIVNNTDSTVNFEMQDFKLYMQMQAFVNNTWTAIERLPEMSCKYPSFRLPLYKGEYWELVCPQYEGVQKVRLRMYLQYYISPEAGFGEIFSNEFSGSINPGQLWRTQENQELYRISVFN